ncbi:hypothetical protein [Dolichospermum sp. UHCC 0259]|uniref:hypothetical protein n=1 Tax=Dolichospermum sp. UHCC 0259 TaxID=2590010 RepID=UPI00144711B8|nr:hypothetical protein [Dolichospermum sp. UHCC 0259]MTJ50250.1 hypothetical protein [Dolichospermum sp. UHCC 0259]
MENWQFLIQKQGDHTWRTLESSNLKIWAGNYRILARSGLNNTDVDVRVTHVSIDEVPPKRRLLKRSRRTNSEGLMAVIPFTQFKPGIWELRCSGDIMSDMLGQSWQRTLLIHVSPLETSLTLPPPLVEESEAVEADTEVSIVMNHGTPVWFKGETTEQILQNLLDLALPEDEPLLDEETIENAPTLPPPLLLNLSLDQDTYIVPWGDNFTIHGDVEVNEIENLADEEFSLGGLCQLRLEIALRSPLESTKILNRIQQPLTNQVLPFGFISLIHIPLNCESKLLLADINLYGALTDVGEVILLANHTFTITANVSELLAIQTLPSPSGQALPEINPPVKPKPSVKIRLELFNVAKTPNLAQFHILKPSPSRPLPPQIKPLVSLKVFSPQLPNLPQNPTPEITTDSPPNSLAKTLAIHPIDLKKLVIKPVNTTLPYLKRLQVKRTSGEIVTNKDVGEKELAPLKKSPLLPTVETSSIKIPELPIDDLPQTDESRLEDTSYAELIAEIVAGANCLQQRFAIADEELNVVDSGENYLILQEEESNVVDSGENYLILQDEESNVVDSQKDSSLLQQWVDSQGYLLIETVSEESSDKDADEEIATQVDFADNLLLELNEPEMVTITSPIITQPGWLSQEIVIDDLLVAEDGDSLGDEAIEDDNYSLVLEDKAIPEKSVVMMESLPTPQLSLPEGELVAGTSVMVRVKILKVSSAVAVKLWVEDYQTRSLLDGPHILSDLRSNAWGEEETAIYLKVPFGCLEIRLSAIALDQTTQQESDKFTIIKTVIPPNLPTIEMDEMLGL